MQKAPVMKGSGLMPLTDDKSSNAEEVHVFGRNLEERVVNNDNSGTPSISFNTAEGNQPSEDDIDSIRKRKFDAITGEEDEETIFQGDFKLFVWDKSTSNWIEKGRGQLKLNDTINQNEKRVITNSKTHIRFTDSQTVWAASGSNASQLKDLIEERRRISPEEENELRKRAKSDSEQQKPTETATSCTTSTTTKITDHEKPSASLTSENQSIQKDSTDISTSSSSGKSQETKGEITTESSPKKKDDGNKGEEVKDDEVAACSKNEDSTNEESQVTTTTTEEKNQN